MNKRLWDLRSKLLRPVPPGLAVALFATVILCINLRGLVPFASIEQPQRLKSANVSSLYHDILYAPIKVLQLTVLKFSQDDTWIRLASVAVGVTTGVLLYLMLRKWYTTRVSVLTSALFICSSWFLHNGRLANVEVLFMGVLPALFLVCMWFLSKHHDKKIPVAVVLLGLSLYVPTAWLFILIGLIYFRKYTLRNIKLLPPKLKILSASLFVITIAPLILSFAIRQRQIVTWLGYDLDQKFNISSFAHNFYEIPKQLFVSGVNDHALWLSGTPIFDIFSLAMLVLGFYAYHAGYYPAREKMVFTSIIVSVLLIGFGHVATLSLLLPLLYIVIANGIAYMLQSWFTVFPKNPVAKPMGVILLSIVVALSCFYNIQRYFVAWPNASATKSAFSKL